MKHLTLQEENGFVKYEMGDRSGSHPLGDDPVWQVIDYLVKIIKPSTFEVLGTRLQ